MTRPPLLRGDERDAAVARAFSSWASRRRGVESARVHLSQTKRRPSFSPRGHPHARAPEDR